MPAGVIYIVVAGAFFQFAGGHISAAGWAAALAYGANYYDLWAGYHSTLPGVRHPFNILWSLAVEEHFYLLWPLLLLALYRTRLAVPAVLGICVGVLLWRLYLLHACFAPGAPLVCAPPNPNPLWRYNRLYLPSDARLDSIAWGALLALMERAPVRAVAVRAVAVRAGAWRAGAWRAVAGGALLAGSFALVGPLGRHGFRPTVQGVGLLGVVPWLVWQDSPVRRVLSMTPALLLGRLSYSLYLWHWGALGVADYLRPGGGAGWLLVAVPLSAGLACASYLGIERPMLRLRRRFGSHAPLTLAAAPPVLQDHAPDIGIVIRGAPYATPPS
jgi:peptidoglycan/LPS O-acetylase OafA/YrhL